MERNEWRAGSSVNSTRLPFFPLAHPPPPSSPLPSTNQIGRENMEKREKELCCHSGIFQYFSGFRDAIDLFDCQIFFFSLFPRSKLSRGIVLPPFESNQ